MKKSALIGFAAGFVFVLLAAGAAMFDTTAQSPGWVTAMPVAKISVAAGQPGKIQMRFKVAEGYHINSHQPGSELLIPTRLQMDPPTDIGVGSIVYPKGHDMTLTVAPDEKLNVYTGEFTIGATVSATRTATPGKYKVHGQLRYQACNDRSCFPPKQLPVAFEVSVLKSKVGGSSTAHNPPQSPHVHR